MCLYFEKLAAKSCFELVFSRKTSSSMLLLKHNSKTETPPRLSVMKNRVPSLEKVPSSNTCCGLLNCLSKLPVRMLQRLMRPSWPAVRNKSLHMGWMAIVNAHCEWRLANLWTRRPEEAFQMQIEVLEEKEEVIRRESSALHCTAHTQGSTCTEKKKILVSQQKIFLQLFTNSATLQVCQISNSKLQLGH